MKVYGEKSGKSKLEGRAEATAQEIADVFRALEGPIASVRGMAPEDLAYEGAAVHLREIWVATRAALRSVLESVTIADLVSGELPEPVRALLVQPGAWERR